MDKLTLRMQLLWLLSIYFIYRIIRAIIESKSDEMILWSLFLFCYVISLIVMLIVVNNWKKREEF